MKKVFKIIICVILLSFVFNLVACKDDNPYGTYYGQLTDNTGLVAEYKVELYDDYSCSFAFRCLSKGINWQYLFGRWELYNDLIDMTMQYEQNTTYIWDAVEHTLTSPNGLVLKKQ